jgi:hypothetical protein
VYFVQQPTGDVAQAIKEFALNSVKKTLLSQNQDVGLDMGTANYVLKLSFTHLDQSYLAHIEKCNGMGDKLICPYSSDLKITTLDDVDVAAKRLTLAALSEKNVDETKKIGEVTDRESDEMQNGVHARRNWKVGLGMSGMYGVKADGGLNYALLLGWSALISKQVAVNIEGTFLFDDDGRALTFVGVGPQYYFSDADIAPYVKGSLDFYTADNNKNSNGGIGFGGAAGMTFFRSSNVNMFVEAGYVIGTKELDASIVPNGMYVITGVAF